MFAVAALARVRSSRARVLANAATMCQDAIKAPVQATLEPRNGSRERPPRRTVTDSAASGGERTGLRENSDAQLSREEA